MHSQGPGETKAKQLDLKTEAWQRQQPNVSVSKQQVTFMKSMECNVLI